MVDINLTIVIQLVSFLFLVFVLKKVLWDPVMRHIDRRDGLIAGRKADIAKLKSEAQELREEYS
ncbi:MAG: ATP synthase F0 subunit B, partial [Candidatus Coatesbacteria bacterium]|nr:ATP synthase F0 subunit B [Candidatus Coatesbacteria bacterium]